MVYLGAASFALTLFRLVARSVQVAKLENLEPKHLTTVQIVPLANGQVEVTRKSVFIVQRVGMVETFKELSFVTSVRCVFGFDLDHFFIFFFILCRFATLSSLFASDNIFFFLPSIFTTLFLLSFFIFLSSPESLQRQVLLKRLAWVPVPLVMTVQSESMVRLLLL